MTYLSQAYPDESGFYIKQRNIDLAHSESDRYAHDCEKLLEILQKHSNWNKEHGYVEEKKV